MSAPERGVRTVAELIRHLDYLLKQYDRLIQAHALVVMDTPEDRELHDRVVSEFRWAAEPVRKLLARSGS